MLDALIEGQTLLADRAYDSDELRQSLDERGAWANIKPMRTAKTYRLSVLIFTDTETWSSASSTKSNITAPWPRDTIKHPNTSSPASNSLRSDSGCALMSRWPKPSDHHSPENLRMVTLICTYPIATPGNLTDGFFALGDLLALPGGILRGGGILRRQLFGISSSATSSAVMSASS
jgi:hypothetical protein